MQQLDDQGQSWKKIIRFKEGEILQYVCDKNEEKRFIYSKHILGKKIMISTKMNRKGNEGSHEFVESSKFKQLEILINSKNAGSN